MGKTSERQGCHISIFYFLDKLIEDLERAKRFLKSSRNKKILENSSVSNRGQGFTVQNTLIRFFV